MKFKSLFQRRSSGDGTSSRKKNQESPYASPVAQDDEPVPDEENGLKNEKPTFCKNCRDVTDLAESMQRSLEAANEKLAAADKRYGNLEKQYEHICDSLTLETSMTGKQKSIIEKLEREKTEIEQAYKTLLNNANAKIESLSKIRSNSARDDNKPRSATNAKLEDLLLENNRLETELELKTGEWELLEKDYLLCISSAERFRTEAEQRAAEVAAAFTKLKEEVDTLKSTHASQIAKKLSMAPESPPATAQVIEPDEPPPAEDLDGDFGDDLENVCETLEETILQLDDDFVQVQGQVTEKGYEEDDKLDLIRKKAGGSLRNALLKWCQDRTRDYNNVEITNFGSSWSDGLALVALVHSCNPKRFDYSKRGSTTIEKNFQVAITAARYIGVTTELEPKDLMTPTGPPRDRILKLVTDIFKVAS